MRDGTPLPGRTPTQLLSQLTYRVFGPLQPTRIRLVLDYHGLLDHRAAALVQIADRHHVTTRTVTNNVATVRAAGGRQPLPAHLIAEATRPSTPVDDHLGRVRITATLGLPQPEPTPVDHPPAEDKDDSTSSTQLAVARTGVRLLAAVGPLTLAVIAAAVARSHRFRDRNPLSDADLAVAMRAAGCTVDDQDRWQPPAGVVPSARDRLIVTRAADRDLTRGQMIDILLAAGYRRSSATGRMSSSQPLFRRTGPDRYRLVGDGDLPGWVNQLRQVVV